MHQKLAAIDWLYILLLSAVWGSAFVFLKIASPVVGADRFGVYASNLGFGSPGILVY